MNIKNHIKQNGILLLIGLLILISLVILGVRTSSYLKGQFGPLINKLYIEDQTVQPNTPFETNILFETNQDKICGLKFDILFLKTVDIDMDMTIFDNELPDKFPWSIQFVDSEEGSDQNPDKLSFETYQFFDEDPLNNNLYEVGTIKVLGGYNDDFLLKLDNVEIWECSGQEYFNVGKVRNNITSDFTLDDGFITVPGDTEPPGIVSTIPADGDTGPEVTINTDLTITFNENVTAVGGKNIEIFKTVVTLPIETIDVADTQVVTGSGTSTITVDISQLPDNAAAYHIKIDPGAFVDDSNNPFVGILNEDFWNFATYP